jgi:hypothetical protein
LLPETQAAGKDELKPRPLQSPSDAVPILKKAVSQLDSEDGWVSLGMVGTQLTNLVSDFDVRTYGFKKLSDLVRKTNIFEIEKVDGGRMRIRIKSKAASVGRR